MSNDSESQQRVRLCTAVAALACAALFTACGGAYPEPDTASAVNAAPTARYAALATTSSSWWTPNISDTWQWQLNGTLNTTYAANVYDIDMFDTPPSTIAALKSQGKRVVCYISAGSAETWRPDYNQFQPSDMGNNVFGWAGERWLDTRSANVRQIMQRRMDLAKSKGCDGIEPDNVDAYSNNSGLPLTAATQLDYNRFIAGEAHARGLAVALKNDVDQLAELASYFDFAVNEECHQYNECDGYTAFTNQGKPVFNAEYASKYRKNTGGARTTLCQASKVANMRTLVLSAKLDDSYRYACD